MRASLRSTLAIVAVVLATVLPGGAAAQDGSWLDGDLAPWNTPGMAIPAAPAVEGNSDPRCGERERPAETAEDDAVTAAGWSLFLPYQRGWGVTLLAGLSGYDGQCRPYYFQWFVFVDGAFAGTVSPEPTVSRSDGATGDVNLWFRDQLGAEFARYAPDDPLCCPSSFTSVEYAIEETADGPVINPVQTT